MRKQAAVTLRCMQALVRVQARVRARRVRLSLECETGQQTLQQQVTDEARVQEIEVMITCLNTTFMLLFNFCFYFLERVLVVLTLSYQGGWCDSIGSVEQIRTKLVKRQEAATKRERAMAYALTHQVLLTTTSILVKDHSFSYI